MPTKFTSTIYKSYMAISSFLLLLNLLLSCFTNLLGLFYSLCV
jgi:hypothetical protein